ncbi:MAG: tetratricopeptide repeat protein [Rhodobacteraceae bacterium]|nr:tetratricopeptide repeat protein [Paracoccaceae bacterium]
MLALSACQAAGPERLSGDRLGPPAPAGTPVVSEAVDGLIVGHRLMAAGEYELALRAYQRRASQSGIDADVLSAMGSANLKLGRLGQAQNLLDAAIREEPQFVAAINNLGVVLMETGRFGEARSAFRAAFALDNGNSEEIRQNLALAIAKSENNAYSSDPEADNTFRLVRRGNGRFLLLSTPD